MAKRYILVESCCSSGCYGITDYFILDLERDIIVEQCGFACFDMADAWYMDWVETHANEDGEE